MLLGTQVLEMIGNNQISGECFYICVYAPLRCVYFCVPLPFIFILIVVWDLCSLFNQSLQGLYQWLYVGTYIITQFIIMHSSTVLSYHECCCTYHFRLILLIYLINKYADVAIVEVPLLSASWLHFHAVSLPQEGKFRQVTVIIILF